MFNPDYRDLLRLFDEHRVEYVDDLTVQEVCAALRRSSM